MPSIEITVNGQPLEIARPISLHDLILSLELKPDRVAVELNKEIVRRDRWPEIELRDQDRLEIVQFVGGG